MKIANNTIPKVNPNIVVCYICGRDFSVHSLSIHEPQCLQKWEAEESKKPVSQRRSPPIKPSLNQVQDASMMNDLLRQTYLDQSRVECEHCNRKFANTDRLAVHQKSCTPTSPCKKSAPRPGTASSATMAVTQPMDPHPMASTPTKEPSVVSKVSPVKASKPSSSSTSSPPSSSSRSSPPISKVPTSSNIASNETKMNTQGHPTGTESTTPKKTMVDKFCSKCGKQFQMEDSFCSQCGKKRN